MGEYMICNTIPIYQEAPVSSELFKRDISKILKAISEMQVDKKYLVVNEWNKELMELLEEQTDACSNLEIITVEAKGGFVFGNATAVSKLIEGEKPIPSGMNENIPVYSVEELLGTDEKVEYIENCSGKKEVHTFEKKIKPRDILGKCDFHKKFKGMYFGYPMGLLLSSEQLDEEVELLTDYVIIFSEDDCILDSLVNITERYKNESCGRCVFGYEGTTQFYMILSDIAQKKGKNSDVELLLGLCNEMQNQSLCDIGTVAANTVVSAIHNFREEIEDHITKKICKASVCSKFTTYHIIADKCTGCNECEDTCDDDAILGKKKFIHVIDQDECVQCGACVNACDEGAIVKAGPIKPKGPKNPIPCKREVK
ncbi:NADP-reducing hydrogenase subunit HndC [Alkalibaculum sp. M08DMB]|uniref:NADP-reducing hydrogenase subunit HndC n=1 Tax=Alkalibaculum sporogenes TaxID=2655001 RepID=A0A6A7K6F1_9FIRM|nr:NADH-ubiquinone oxidoreductase-F iron-sulfur binding region domain-containing protein [Alkalibaculum sporogenes]MPW24733.1 NADP-reducing hydrogenase subunit HndC [Alkalibaculum sporogenes]